MSKYSKILDKIKEYDKITIFRHVSPDGDAVFSQMALYTFIKDNFKNKKVRKCGFEDFELYPNVERVSDSFIEDSLAIVVDTSDRGRVDDLRFLNAKYIIKIDHHPPYDAYGNINCVDTNTAAACELITDILFSEPFKKYKKSPAVCEFLYSGMLTDTLNFKTASCTAQTLAFATILVKQGNIKMSDRSDYLFSKSIAEFNGVSKLRNHLKIKGHFGYLLLEKKELDEIGLSYSAAKNNIAEFGNIKDINVWVICVYNDDKKYYEASIRSKRKYIINETVRKYGGGGHKNASGVRGLKKAQVKLMLNDLEIIANKKL